jgi:hypothetical protein
MSQKTKLVLVSALVIITPLLAFAQVPPPSTGTVNSACDIVVKIVDLVKIFGTIILVVAVIMLLYAAFLFITGGGNEERIKTARSILIYALIGLAVAILATSAQTIVKGLVGGTFIGSCASATF